MKKSRMKGIGSIICLFLATVLFCTPAMAYTGENWYNTDIDGAVTADTPEARPQDDFNLALNRDYIMNLVIPEGNIGAGGFNTIRQQVNQMRLEAIQDETLTGHDAELVRKYYDLLMDWDTRDAQGVSPAMPYIDEIRAIDSLEDMTAWFADGQRGGLYAFGDGNGHGADTGGLFAYGLCISADDSTARALAIFPVELSLGDPAEYEELTENGKQQKERVTAVWTALLDHLGFSEDEAARMIGNAFDFETLLAAQQSDLEAQKDPANVANYWNPTDLAGIEAMCGAFPAVEILKSLGLDQANLYNVTEPEYMKALEGIYTEDNLELMRDWLTVRTAEQWTGYLDKATRDDVKAASDSVMGIQGTESDEILAVRLICGDLALAADNLYIAKYCTPQLRDEIVQIIHSVIEEYHKMLAEEDWLSEATRAKADEKLDNIIVNAVYPDIIETCDDLDFDADGGLLEAYLTIRKYIREKELARVNEPVKREEWNRSHMPTSQVNAFYSPEHNSINILAGILNDPFFQSDYSYEEKLGIMGVVIGHEISHAFDPRGSQYDKDGRVASWWTDEDKAAFVARSKKLVDYYDNLKLFDDIKYSGTRVQGEAIADMGGMKVALRIAAGVEDFDYKKFFEAYARLWAMRFVKSTEVWRAQVDEHPLCYLRTNVTVMQFDEFQKAYDVHEGDGMYVAPEDRICVW